MAQDIDTDSFFKDPFEDIKGRAERATFLAELYRGFPIEIKFRDLIVFRNNTRQLKVVLFDHLPYPVFMTIPDLIDDKIFSADIDIQLIGQIKDPRCGLYSPSA